jgi:hypothetical protein
MKAAAAFASLMAPHIERYLTLKQALGREYDDTLTTVGSAANRLCQKP